MDGYKSEPSCGYGFGEECGGGFLLLYIYYSRLDGLTGNL